MDILLTGSNGFLGKEIYNNIELNNVKTLSRSNSDFNVDLSDTIPNFEMPFDLVIHTAGKAHIVPKKDVEKISFHKVNVQGTINLLKGLCKHKPKYFIYISSVSVYGLTEGDNINESYPLTAKEPYGKSKIQAENLVQNWCEQNEVICTILRLPIVVGFNPPGNLGALISGIQKGYYFNISGGHVRKSMVLGSDVGKIILKIASIGGIYNLTDGRHPSFNEISKKISLNFGKTYVPNLSKYTAFFLSKIGDLIGDVFPINSNKFYKLTKDLTFDDSKARISFGWNPTSVLEGLKFN
jgi:nucleoside-diphosphate-sugar epimerase